jgi:4-amino-4-deoxy-L-arabinose transferase-like glycosyltransferase
VTTVASAPATAPPSTPTPDRKRRSFVGWLAVIAIAGAAVRLMNVFWWRPTTDRVGYLGYKLGGDAFYYHWQANALARGHWFIDPFRWLYTGAIRPSAAHPPLYTLYLAVWSRLGVDTVTGHRVVSGLLGVAAVVVIGILGNRLGGRTAGLIAAGVAALYPELWINDGMLLSESIAVLATACALLATYAYWRTPRLRNAVLMGATCGIAALSRTELALLFPFMVLPLVATTRSVDVRARVRLCVAAFAAGALVLVPWVGFNMLRFREPTFISTGTGGALAAASCDGVYYGKFIGYYANCFTGPWPGPKFDESERDLVPRRQARAYIDNHLSRLPVVVAARVGRLWAVFKPGQTTWLDWWLEGRGRAPSYIGLFSYYLLMPFAIGGLVVMRRRRIPILPFIVLALVATIAAAVTFGVTRYRAPAEVAIVIAAGVGAAAALDWLRARRATRVDDLSRLRT